MRLVNVDSEVIRLLIKRKYEHDYGLQIYSLLGTKYIMDEFYKKLESDRRIYDLVDEILVDIIDAGMEDGEKKWEV